MGGTACRPAIGWEISEKSDFGALGGNRTPIKALEEPCFIH